MSRLFHIRIVVLVVVVALGSSLMTGTAMAALAGAPTALNPTASNSQVALTWAAPASDGGEAISD